MKEINHKIDVEDYLIITTQDGTTFQKKPNNRKINLIKKRIEVRKSFEIYDIDDLLDW